MRLRRFSFRARLPDVREGGVNTQPIRVRASGLTVSRKNRPWQPEADSRLSPGPAGHIVKCVVKRNAGHPLVGAYLGGNSSYVARTCGNHAFAPVAQTAEHRSCKSAAVGAIPTRGSTCKSGDCAGRARRPATCAIGRPHSTRATNRSQLGQPCERGLVAMDRATPTGSVQWVEVR